MMQQPRTKFSEMEPASEQGAPPGFSCQQVQQGLLNESGVVGEGLDDEVPGSVRANTDTVRPADLLLPQQQAGTCLHNMLPVKLVYPQTGKGLHDSAHSLFTVSGDLNQITTHTHPQMADPTLAAATRSRHRAEAKAPGGSAATNVPSGTHLLLSCLLAAVHHQLRHHSAMPCSFQHGVCAHHRTSQDGFQECPTRLYRASGDTEQHPNPSRSRTGSLQSGHPGHS